MAYATQITISTGNRVSLNYQSQEVSVTLTYQLEREDSDVLRLVSEKSGELAQAHQTAWQTLRDAKVAAAAPVVPVAEPNAAVETATMPATEVAPAIVEAVSNPAAAEIASDEIAPPIAAAQAAALSLLLNQAGWSDEQRQAHLRERFGCGSIEGLTAPQAAQWLLEMQRASRVAAQQQRLAALNGSHDSSDGTNGAKTIRYSRSST